MSLILQKLNTKSFTLLGKISAIIATLYVTAKIPTILAMTEAQLLLSFLMLMNYHTQFIFSGLPQLYLKQGITTNFFHLKIRAKLLIIFVISFATLICSGVFLYTNELSIQILQKFLLSLILNGFANSLSIRFHVMGKTGLFIFLKELILPITFGLMFITLELFFIHRVSLDNLSSLMLIAVCLKLFTISLLNNIHKEQSDATDLVSVREWGKLSIMPACNFIVRIMELSIINYFASADFAVIYIIALRFVLLAQMPIALYLSFIQPTVAKVIREQNFNKSYLNSLTMVATLISFSVLLGAAPIGIYFFSVYFENLNSTEFNIWYLILLFSYSLSNTFGPTGFILNISQRSWFGQLTALINAILVLFCMVTVNPYNINQILIFLNSLVLLKGVGNYFYLRRTL